MNGPPHADRRQVLAGSLAALATLAAGCAAASTPTAGPAGRRLAPQPSHRPRPHLLAATTDPKVIASRARVPVLCWHQLRDWHPADAGYARRLLICPPAVFRAQLDALSAAGYSTITADQYLAHLTTGAGLPPRPVLLSFDDSQPSQINEGLPQLARRSMTATFFVMTVVLGKPGWMTRDDLHRLDAAGMSVAAHTWDHHRADRYTPADYPVQFDQPRALLEKVLAKPVRHFAYPYGAWNSRGFAPLHAAGYATAFQLSDKAMDPRAPLHTLRRILVDSTWTRQDLLARLQSIPAPA